MGRSQTIHCAPHKVESSKNSSEVRICINRIETFSNPFQNHFSTLLVIFRLNKLDHTHRNTVSTVHKHDFNTKKKNLLEIY